MPPVGWNQKDDNGQTGERPGIRLLRTDLDWLWPSYPFSTPQK
jgi:hypothetical protein